MFKPIVLVTALLAGILVVGFPALAQDGHRDHAHGKDQQTAPSMDDAMMKAWMDASSPGPQHKALEAMAGKFTYTSRFRMDPSQDWMSSDGEYQGEMALGGRFLLTQVSGSVMGMQLTGMGCLGYDNIAQKFVSGWIDNMGTGIMRSEGTADAPYKTITFAGEMLDPT